MLRCFHHKQGKEIIRELRSKGLSFRKMVDDFREPYSVDIPYATPQQYFK